MNDTEELLQFFIDTVIVEREEEKKKPPTDVLVYFNIKKLVKVLRLSVFEVKNLNDYTYLSFFDKVYSCHNSNVQFIVLFYVTVFII